jgi:LacI family transcriptional regulator
MVASGWGAMARTTIDDVAARAGVSIKTVSRVLNDEPGVRPETRERVRSAMTALNYHPSLPARSLAGRRSNLLGLVYENPSANYVFDVQNGAMAKCRDAKLRLFVLSCNDLGERTVGEVLAMADQTHVDGLVLTPPLSANHDLIAALDAQHLPFVRVAPDALDHSSPKVEIDDRAAARDMTEHLIGLGHRSIAFIAGHPDHYSTQLRLEGFRSALLARSMAADEARIEHGFNTSQSGAEAARRLLGHADRPTAIFASNDDMAAGVILVAHELGIAVPRQLSVAGFDDTQLAQIVWPPLTTIHQPSYDMAYAATDLLARLVRGQEVPATTLLDHKLVIRKSTAPVS